MCLANENVAMTGLSDLLNHSCSFQALRSHLLANNSKLHRLLYKVVTVTTSAAGGTFTLKMSLNFCFPRILFKVNSV